ncbi:MAG: tRNA pseudouridine(38-40) synthase TruA [Bacteroidota bacterium]
MLHRYFIKLLFNGTFYHGWQIQPNANTVQQDIECALKILLKRDILITGAGRTDTGVHAKEFYAHFDFETEFTVTEINKLIYQLNSIISSDIAILSIIPVRKDAHARFDAIARTYSYYIHNRKDPFLNNFSFLIPHVLNQEAMQAACRLLYEYSDFSCFSKSHTQVKTNNCNITFAEWRIQGHQIIFTIRADRFLRNMVRAIVGSMLEIGNNKMDFEGFRKVIESKNRSEAGYSVPACGLFLEKIEYPGDVFLLS